MSLLHQGSFQGCGSTRCLMRCSLEACRLVRWSASSTWLFLDTSMQVRRPLSFAVCRWSCEKLLVWAATGSTPPFECSYKECKFTSARLLRACGIWAERIEKQNNLHLCILFSQCLILSNFFGSSDAESAGLLILVWL